MIGILVFDNIVRYILLFYFLVLSSNACTNLSLMHVMRHYEVPEGEGLKRRTRIYYYFMNIIYFLMVIAAFIPALAPVCSDLMSYPTTLYSGNVLFLVNACFFWFMFVKNFFFNLSEEVNEKSPLIQP